MTEYHKIETLFERDRNTFVVDPTKLKSPVLATISEWDVTEKIDGTNIRVMLSPGGAMTFGGRTERANIPADLIQFLMMMFTSEKLKEVFWRDGLPIPGGVVLYGEGYGAGIQKEGRAYREDKSFILFDVLVDGKWWMDKTALVKIAEKLGIDVVPYLGRMTLPQIVEFVKVPFKSKIGTATAEGIVARPIEPLFDRRGERVIIKLKTRDFFPGKKI